MQSITNNLTKLWMSAALGLLLLLFWKNTQLSISLPDIFTVDTSILHRASNTETSVWEHLSHNFKLDNQANLPQVQKEIRKLLADQNKLYSILEAAAPYIYFISQQIETRHLPAEIALIPIIESEFNPNDRSHKGALGLWQLMSGTAHGLGVKIKSGYDGRRNVIMSTKAALAYFTDLGIYFKGNWYLAFAAYNSGENRVKSAMRRAKSSSFWNLRLPKETKLYVPKLLAVATILKNHEKYGIELPKVTNTPYFSEIKVKKAVNLAQVSKLSGVSLATLNSLNPDYRITKKSSKATDTLLVPTTHVLQVRSVLQ